MDPNELRRNAAQWIEQAQDIGRRAQAENRDLTEEEYTQLGELETKATRAIEQAARFERLEEMRQQQDAAGGRRGNPLPHQDPENTRNGRHQFSVLKCFRAALSGRGLDGIEEETQAEITKRFKKDSRGFWLPMDLPVRRDAVLGARETRAALTSTTGAGAIGDTVLPTMIDVLRSRMLLRQLGAQVLSDLVGTVSVPKKTAASTAEWVAETDEGTEKTITIGQVELSPSTLRAHTAYSRKLMVQTSMDVEQMVREDLSEAVALGLDKAGLNGSGTGAEPEGLLQNTNVATIPLGTDGDDPSWGAIVSLKSGVDSSNALQGSLHYVTTPAGRGKLETTPKETGYPVYLLDDVTGVMAGYPVWSTSQLPSDLTKGTGEDLSPMIFGDWTSCMYGIWGALDVLVNPYSEDKAGRIRVTVFQECDFQVRRAEAFRKIVDMVTS